jgi:hypothetical protein
MSKTRLLAAKELILNKQYDAARTLLETLPDDAIAQKWLQKLDEIAPKPLPLDSLPTADRETTRWQTAMLIATRDAATGEVTVILDGVAEWERVVMKSTIHSLQGALVDAADMLGKRGWEVAGMDRGDDGTPFFVMKRPVRG